jgi:hypothetical protein
MDFYRPDSLQGVLESLDSVYRAFRAWKFYPLGHPTRKNSIQQAHSSMLAILDGSHLSLVCGRTGFSLPEREPFKDNTNLTSALSYELFIRRVQKITFLSDLHQDDLLDLIRILALPHDDIQLAGGVNNLLSDHGVRTIWVNEFDLSAIRSRRQAVEAAGIVPQGVDELENMAVMEAAVNRDTSEEVPGMENKLRAVLARLSATRDEGIYLELVRQAISCAEVLRSRRELQLLLPMVVLLADHVEDGGRGGNLKECARFGLEQLAGDSQMIDFLLDRVAVTGGIGKGTMLTVLKVAGPAGIALTVEKLAAAENPGERKTLSTLLLQLGEPAVPSILAMMVDRRWHVVRNLAAILGEIASPEAVDGLGEILRHSDLRVCKEAIRSLAKIGGRDAETAIITVLQGNDTLLLPQAITSLGGMQSRTALPVLMQLLGEKSVFLKTLPLKLDILSAIAMIGDSSVVPRLVDLLLSRHLLARARWNQLKVALAACLGKLGDPRSLAALAKLSRASGELGRACTDAIEAIQRCGVRS